MTNANQYRIDQTLLIIKGQEWAWPSMRLISSSNFSQRACKERLGKKSAPKRTGPTGHTTCPSILLGLDHMQKWGLGFKGPRKEGYSPVYYKAGVEHAQKWKYLRTENMLSAQSRLSGAVVCTFPLCDLLEICKREVRAKSVTLGWWPWAAESCGGPAPAPGQRTWK